MWGLAGRCSGQGAGVASLACLMGSYLEIKWAHGCCPQLFAPLERAAGGGVQAGEGIAARWGQERRRSLGRERQWSVGRMDAVTGARRGHPDRAASTACPLSHHPCPQYATRTGVMGQSCGLTTLISSLQGARGALGREGFPGVNQHWMHKARKRRRRRRRQSFALKPALVEIAGPCPAHPVSPLPRMGRRRVPRSCGRRGMLKATLLPGAALGFGACRVMHLRHTGSPCQTPCQTLPAAVM